MSDPNVFLANAMLILGVLGIIGGGLMMGLPATCRIALAMFPRSRIAGQALTLAAFLWAAWILNSAELGRFAFIQPYVYILACLCAGIVCTMLKELLAVRALGALMILAGDPILDGIRWAASPAHYLVAILVYCWVIEGCLFMLYPWFFRRVVDKLMPTLSRLRAYGGLKFAGSLVFLVWGILLK